MIQEWRLCLLNEEEDTSESTVFVIVYRRNVRAIYIYTILKAPVSIVIFLQKSPYIYSKSTQRKMLKSGA
jgi:hypothetical protein